MKLVKSLIGETIHFNLKSTEQYDFDSENGAIVPDDSIELIQKRLGGNISISEVETSQPQPEVEEVPASPVTGKMNNDDDFEEKLKVGKKKV